MSKNHQRSKPKTSREVDQKPVVVEKKVKKQAVVYFWNKFAIWYM
jgi:PHD/YefM family antitoxin component YafN of YafNO toxin-antitoxin module